MIPTHTYFLFGVCDEGGLPSYCDMIQEVGCEVVSIASGMMPAPQNRLAIRNGDTPPMLAVAKVYVRCPAGTHPEVIERLKAHAAYAQRANK